MFRHLLRLHVPLLAIFLSLGPAVICLADSPGKAVFEERCQRCHTLPNPSEPPEMGWEARLQLMAKVANLTPTQKDEVLSYLQSHSQTAEKSVSFADEKLLFESKCSLCHTLDRIFLTPLDEESRQHIVKRMSDKAPGWITQEESDLILDYLGRMPSVKRASKATDKADDIFRERCSACHSLERVYSRLVAGDASSWSHIVQRMQSKAPQWLSKEDADKVVEYLRSIVSAPKE